MTDTVMKDEAQARLRNLCEVYGLTVGGVYEHYKEHLYVIVALSVHEATGEPLVTYRSNRKGTCWTRTVENFTEYVSGLPVRRFRRVDR